jgi:hypothetical protein
VQDANSVSDGFLKQGTLNTFRRVMGVVNILKKRAGIINVDSLHEKQLTILNDWSWFRKLKAEDEDVKK